MRMEDGSCKSWGRRVGERVWTVIAQGTNSFLAWLAREPLSSTYPGCLAWAPKRMFLPPFLPLSLHFLHTTFTPPMSRSLIVNPVLSDQVLQHISCLFRDPKLLVILNS